MNLLINVDEVSLGQRRRIANMIAELPANNNIEVTQHPTNWNWLVAEVSAKQYQIDDVGCMRQITYGDWSDPA